MNEKKVLKKSLSLLIAMVMCWITSSVTVKDVIDEINANAVSNFIIGDVNNDSHIDSFDIVLLRKAIVNSESSLEMESADVNGDNIIDVRDLRELQQFVLGERTNFSSMIIKDINNRDTSIVTPNEPIETSLTAEMAEKAKELGSIQSVYNYLYNNMRSEFYYGSRKGAIGAFEQGGGNDTDLSSLLIAMLRHLGYDADYVTSNVGFTEEQLLKLTNTDSIDIANYIMSNGRKCTLKNINNKTYYLYNYKYVQVIDSGKTYYLDVYFKEYVKQLTMYNDIDSIYTLTESNADSIINNFDLNFLNSEIEKCSDSMDKLVNNKYALHSNKIVSKNITKLPAELPYYSANSVVSESLTDNESAIISIGFNNGEQKTIRVADVYKKNITVSYEVYSPDDYEGFIDTSSIFVLPSKFWGDPVAVVPIIKIDGKEDFYGPPLNIGNTQTLDILIESPGVEKVDCHETLSAGEMCSIVFDIGQISANELASAYTDALENTQTINQKNKYTCDMELNESLNSKLNEKNVYSTDYLGNLLRLTGVMYFSQLDISSQALAERNNIHSENYVRFGVFGFKPEVYTGSLSANGKDGIQKEGNYFVDILSNHSRSISKNNDAIKLQAFDFSRGLISSELESSVLEEIFNVESLSTTTIFRHAQENDIPIVTISPTSETKISDLKISSSDKKNIQAELDAGRTVITTQSSVKLGSWSGVGYITISPDGSQEYMISGNYKGGLPSYLVGFFYAINVSLDLLMIIESIGVLMSILTAMSTLAIVPVSILLAGVVSIELIVFDILEQSLLYYESEFQNNVESGMQIWASTLSTGIISIVTFGASIGINKISLKIAESRLTSRFGKNVINNITKTSGFSTSEINLKIKQFENFGINQTTINTLLKNPKCMLISDDILKVIGQCGKYSDDLARLVINHDDDFSKLAITLFSDQGISGIELLNKTFNDSYMIWYKISSASKNMAIGKIPVTFQFRVGDIILWTSEDITANMNNYVSKFGLVNWSVNLKSELMLQSYALSLTKAIEYLKMKPAGKYENLTYDNWEFGIDTSNNNVIYAIYLD